MTATMTPVQAVETLAAMNDKLVAAKASLASAKEMLDESAQSASQSIIDAIIADAKEVVRIITIEDIKDVRVMTVIAAAATGLPPKQIKEIAEAVRVSSKGTITLPAGKFETLSRGKGWCRLGSGSNVIWGDRTDNGYEINRAGKWIVGSNDGFSRKEQTEWDVTRIGNYWIAN